MTTDICTSYLDCGALNASLLTEIGKQEVVNESCQAGACGERIILVLPELTVCMTGLCKEESEEFPDWARPATCAAISITALAFFSLMYFGKSCSESRFIVEPSQTKL